MDTKGEIYTASVLGQNATELGFGGLSEEIGEELGKPGEATVKTITVTWQLARPGHDDERQSDTFALEDVLLALRAIGVLPPALEDR